METNIICEALRNDILAYGVPSATLGAFEDIVIQECANRAVKFYKFQMLAPALGAFINEDSIRTSILSKE